MPLLVLWDVDHTLIENAGVSKDIYAAAFEALAGISSRHPAPTEGRTDPSVMDELFRLHGLEVPPWTAVADALEVAGRERLDDLTVRGHVLPGVREALEALRNRPGVVQSVLTGNIKPNAWVKLAAFGLEASVDLAVGAYGGDGPTRGSLVQVARDRAARRHGLPGTMTTVLVGDTPRDVEAGAVGGAHVLAVATGIHSVAQLQAAGAAVVFPDLEDTAGFLAVLSRLESAGLQIFPKGRPGTF